MTTFECWLNGCEINKTIIYPLEGSGDTALYKCWRTYTSGNREYSTSAVYIGWVDGKQVCAMMDYLPALRCWKGNMELKEKER